MQLQGLPAGNRTRILWITRPVLYHWATEAVADNLGASSVPYIYSILNINEMVMPVKYKGIYINNNIWHLHSLSIDEYHGYAFLGNLSVVKICIIRPKIYIYIYWTRAQVVGNSFCSSVVEHWSGNPEDAGSIPSRKALELHFSQLVLFWVL